MTLRTPKPWLFTLATLLTASTVSAADVHVMISAGFYGLYSELSPAFEREGGHRLVTTRGPSMGDSPEAIPARLARGETADVVILDGGVVDELGRKGFVRTDTKIELARSLIGMVVRAGAAKPNIGSVQALRNTLLAAKSIAYSDSGSGTYLRPRCSRSSASQTKSSARVERCEDRRPASRSLRLSRAAKRRSASNRSAN